MPQISKAGTYGYSPAVQSSDTSAVGAFLLFSTPLRFQNFLREILTVSAWDKYLSLDHNHPDSERYRVDKVRGAEQGRRRREKLY